jgi:hypothetical protein
MAVGDEIELRQSFSESALNSVREKLGQRRLQCQLCGEHDWQLQDKPAFVFLVAPEMGENSLLSGGKQDGLPLVVMTCKNCGNTLLINSKVLDVNHSGNWAKDTQPKHD